MQEEKNLIKENKSHSIKFWIWSTVFFIILIVTLFFIKGMNLYNLN